MYERHIQHDVYTVYVLKNMVRALKAYSDDLCVIYPVALNMVTLLEDNHKITMHEFRRLVDTFGRIYRENWHR